jgi:hypothetical protein
MAKCPGRRMSLVSDRGHTHRGGRLRPVQAAAIASDTTIDGEPSRQIARSGKAHPRVHAVRCRGRTLPLATRTNHSGKEMPDTVTSECLTERCQERPVILAAPCV